MEPVSEEICAGSNSSGLHSLQCSSQQQMNMHQQQKEEIEQHGEQQHQQLMQEWQQQLEDPLDQQEQFELDQTQHLEQSQLQPYVENEHRHLEPPQLQLKQQWQPDQGQQLQQVQMQQMLQHTQQQHLQEIHSQQQKLQQSQDRQELVTQLQQQLQPRQQESPSQSEQQDMDVQLQQQDLPLQELELQLQQQELALQLQQQQLTPQMPHEDLKQMTQVQQQQQLEQSAAEPQQQHLQQLQQSQMHLQQPQKQQHFPLQPQQQYVPQSQQQSQQSSLEPQHQHLQPLSQQLPQPQQETQQQQLQLLSQHQQQSEQLPLQSQEQHLPQSQQRPQQQLQQSTLASQHQHLQQLPQPQQLPQLQQAPLPSQQQHMQQLVQSQQKPQQMLQQMSLQQQQQHLQQSQQQSQQHLQQASMSSHQQTQQQLPHPQQQHLQPLSQPPKQHLQQLPQSQQQRSQQLPQAQQQLQQPQAQQQRSQLQPHMQQLSQSQLQLQQKQLQPQVQQQQQQQQQQQLSGQHPSQPAVGQAATSVRGQNISGSHSISFGSLIPMILPHLSKEQSDRLQGLYTRLRRNEVTKEDFLRATRNVVGDQMLVQAVRQMQHKHQGQSQLAPSSQASQLHQQQLQQQQQRQQQHAQGSSQQFLPQQSIHTQQVNEPQPFQQVSPTNLQPQPHSQTSAAASLTVPHTSSDNKTQQSRQPGEPRPEISSVHGNQTTTMNLHQVKHEVDRTMIGFPLSSQQQQQHLQVPPSSFPMYARPPGNYSSQSFSASPGIPLGGVKSLAQDSPTKQVMHPQVGVQAHGGPPQLSNIKNVSKYDLSKQAKRREDEERQKILQSSGSAHFSGQHQPSVWATSLEKEKAGTTGISPSSSVHIKQEINDNSDQQHNLQTLQPMKDSLSTIKGGPMDHGQSLMLTKTDSVEHQSIKASGISSASHPLGSSGLHSDHLMQAPLATSAATLHHTLSGFSGPVQMRPQVPSTPPSTMAGSQIKTPPKKMLIGQKKPFDASGSSMQLANKKQKVSAGYLDQSIDQLNDVTAVSGVNLREEEEQLFAGPKEESRATEAMRKVVQEEEERFFLQKGSLRAKLAGIMAKYGIRYVSSDSERCLSLCVEERLRTMIGHLIRLSKQRVDLERASHKVTITSDVRCQILAMNKKAKDDLEKKQAEEAEKIRKLNEIENVGPEGEKDETRTKAQKAQKEEDDKMRANAANVAARAAVGGDDMLSKWQLMAEQARQKREGTSDGASNTRSNKDANRKSVVGGLKSTNVSDHQDTPSTGVARNLGRTSGPLSQSKPVRSICIKDVIALLEREPQMTKSTLLYRLYERDADGSKEKGTEVQNTENTLQ